MVGSKARNGRSRTPEMSRRSRRRSTSRSFSRNRSPPPRPGTARSSRALPPPLPKEPAYSSSPNHQRDSGRGPPQTSSRRERRGDRGTARSLSRERDRWTSKPARRSRQQDIGGVSRKTERREHTSSRRIRRTDEAGLSDNNSDTGGIQTNDIDSKTDGGAARIKRHIRRPIRSLSNSSVDSDALVQPSQRIARPPTADVEKQTVDEEVSRRVELAVEKRVQQIIHSDQFQRETQERLLTERARLEAEMKAELEREKWKIVDEFRRQELEKKQKSQQLEDILAENERKIKEQQIRLAEEQAKRDEERLIELQRRQLQIEEEKKRRRAQEAEQGVLDAQSMAKKTRVAFKLGGADALL